MMTTAVTSKRTLTGSIQSAFQDFFLAEADRLKRLANFLVGDAEQGAELAQEALVRAYRHWGLDYRLAILEHGDWVYFVAGD